jgi:hypothetical protein
MNKFASLYGEMLKNIFQGSIGAIAFGTYHLHNYNKIIEINNEKLNIEHKYLLDKINEKHSQELSDIKKYYDKKIKLLNKKLNNNK